MQDGTSDGDNNVIKVEELNGNRPNRESKHVGAPQDHGSAHFPDMDHEVIANGASSATEWEFRGRKRKLEDVLLGKSSRHISPPWKKVEAEGPTSFVEEGRRKSARTNAVPLELQPSSSKRQTRAGHQRRKEEKQVVQPTLNGTSHCPSKESRAASIKSAAITNGIHHPPPTRPSTPRSHKKVSHRPNHEVAPNKRHSRASNTVATSADALALQSPNLSQRKTRQRRLSYNAPIQESKTNDDVKATAKAGLETSTSASKQVRSLRLIHRPRPLPVINPSNLVPPRKYATLKDLLETDTTIEGEDELPLTNAQAKAEAQVILQLEEAAKPGGLLSEARWTGDSSIIQEEPDIPYTHPDYLLKHIADFQPRLERERVHHIALAKRLAYLAYGEWRRRQPKSEEEIWEDKMKQVRTLQKELLKEIKNKWEAVTAVVRQRKLEKWQENEVTRRQEALKQMVNQSSNLLAGRLQTNHSNPAELEEESSEVEHSDAELASRNSSGESESQDDTDTSASTESDAENEDAISDDMLTTEQLKTKYDHSEESRKLLPSTDASPVNNGLQSSDAGLFPPDLQVDTHPNQLYPPTTSNDQILPSPADADEAEDISLTDARPGAINPAEHELDDVDDVLLDDSDDDEDDGTDDDNDDDSDQDSNDSGSEEEESGEESADEAPKASLYEFFGKKQQQSIAERVKPDDEQDGHKTVLETDTAFDEQEDHRAVAKIMEDVQNDPPKVEHVTDLQDLEMDNVDVVATDWPADQPIPALHSTGDDASRQSSPAPIRPSEEDSVTPMKPYAEAQILHKRDVVEPLYVKTKVPSLLRGQLRVYQHAGLDWLAGLYENRTNGILADEMGLGKTIQTISLLAHLATEHHIWGPHLVVVPTSVMLNWEMEFKKFLPGFKILTYYGTQEERKQKRRGWMDDDRWNVCITSYQLALQDASSLKRRNWHYMVLDEAHNIKNFKSQRWQTMLNFKTEARLLLTGTPLQNNLVELWSLLFFLSPGSAEQGSLGGYGFADLQTFAATFRKPVEQILEHGREVMDEDSKNLVTELHKVLRPHLLRRLKADVEKQMPKKYEHIVKCRLSKRQRQLYDGYMGLAGTRESFQSGNYLSIINCLMQLRKVCNHPDLFETRQIVTSYAMPKSAIADYEIKELLVRKRLVDDDAAVFATHDLMTLWRKNFPTDHVHRAQRLAAFPQLAAAADQQHRRLNNGTLRIDCQTSESALNSLDIHFMRERLSQLQDQYSLTSSRTQRQPVYGSRLLDRLAVVRPLYASSKTECNSTANKARLERSTLVQEMVTTMPQRAEEMEVYVQKFGCITPAAVAPEMARLALTNNGTSIIKRSLQILPDDPFHEARTRLSIAFPDKNLIQYDCGKLQQLDPLLRTLQAGGHRALIFTQMTKVLDILEQFLNLHGHRYLRLDGSTKIEQRQVLTDRFNNDTRILAFILSSRSGGLGINLTGADTVIFYDLDWNPAMDKQCQDRCHRIGQTRDVHIYRFVSEGTIEANILRKSNQKRMLDDVVIQEGDFTTEYFNKIDPAEFLDENAEAGAALDKVLGGGVAQPERVFETAEDIEDREAARIAQTEDVHIDEADFDEKPTTTGSALADTPKTDLPATPVDQSPSTPLAEPSAQAPNVVAMPHEYVPMADRPEEAAPEEEQGEEEPGSYDEYMLRHMTWEWRDVVVKPMSERQRKRSKKGRDHAGIRIRR